MPTSCSSSLTRSSPRSVMTEQTTLSATLTYTVKHLFLLGASVMLLIPQLVVPVGIAYSFTVANAYDILRDYSGQNFFNGWDFYDGWDNLTLGDAWYLDQQSALQQQLAYVNAQGNAIIKVDNSSNLAFGQKRNSIRITSHDGYNIGSLWIFDVLHLPYGCSVWPAIWSFGPNWPFDGEIDILENINMALDNQMALHTTPGCFAQANALQSGIPLQPDCSTGEGCTVRESKVNSYQSGFAAAGGGVWAVQFDSSGIYMWFWSRADVPAEIKSSTSTSPITNLTAWGPPSAAYPSTTCNIPQFFSAQNLVFDITLCGDWAGIPDIYKRTCSVNGSTGICYNDNVPGPGNKFDNAYFEIPYVRIYTTSGPAPTVTPDSSNSFTLVQATTTTTISAQMTTFTTTMEYGGYLTPITGTPSGSNHQNEGGSSSTSSSEQTESTKPSSALMVSTGRSLMFSVMIMMITMTIL